MSEQDLNGAEIGAGDRKSTRLNSSHSQISYAVFCLKKKKHLHNSTTPVSSFTHSMLSPLFLFITPTVRLPTDVSFARDVDECLFLQIVHYAPGLAE